MLDSHDQSFLNTYAPNSSQGSALIANVVSQLEPEIKDKTKGVVLFGYTKNAQTNGQIPNYPPEQTKVYCSQSDGVCSGSLAVTPGKLPSKKTV